MTDGILLKHLSDYPLMQPEDVVKLYFQRYLGPGHLVSDAERVSAMILRELPNASFDAACKNPEPIGNGYYRYHLKFLDETYGSLQLCSDFIRSASFLKDIDGAKKELSCELTKLCGWDELYENAGFSKEDFTSYVNNYINAGCPIVSHSEIFRSSYRPAYRVIRKE